METLTEQDIDTLIKMQNKLIRMRKREAANTNSDIVIEQLTETINQVNELREWIEGRFN